MNCVLGVLFGYYNVCGIGLMCLFVACFDFV